MLNCSIQLKNMMNGKVHLNRQPLLRTKCDFSFNRTSLVSVVDLGILEEGYHCKYIQDSVVCGCSNQPSTILRSNVNLIIPSYHAIRTIYRCHGLQLVAIQRSIPKLNSNVTTGYVAFYLLSCAHYSAHITY